MSDLQKLTMRREDVDALEDAAHALMRRSATEQATHLYALVMRLRTEAGWTPRPSDAWSQRALANVVELRDDANRTARESSRRKPWT